MDELYTRLLAFVEKNHEDNRKRLKAGFKALIIVPIILIILMLVTGSSRIAFMLIWIMCMFVIAAWLIFISYIDHELMDKLEEVKALAGYPAEDASTAEEAAEEEAVQLLETAEDAADASEQPAEGEPETAEDAEEEAQK